MPATPAWPPASAPRLFVEHPLAEGGEVRIDGSQAHYLIQVMRLKPGGAVKLFDDRSGEWLAEASAIGKRDVLLTIAGKLRDREAVPDLWLCAAPIRKGRIDWVAEKACELGVARFVPVLTRRAVVDRVNTARLRAHMIEAAEQCGRTALPEVAEPVTLAQLLASWPPPLAPEGARVAPPANAGGGRGRTLFFADEEGGASALEAMQARPGPAAILIGPEGGFDPPEREAIRALPDAVAIGLGPRILRADTAAVAAVALWMASSESASGSGS